MCFRPVELNKLMKKCPSCQAFNPPALEKCKKCGATMQTEEPKQAPGENTQ